MDRVTVAESDDEFWARLLGDDDPCASGKDWHDRVVIMPFLVRSIGDPVTTPENADYTEGTDHGNH